MKGKQNSIIDKFSNIANVDFLHSDGGDVTNERSELSFADEVRDSYDYLATNGDVLGIDGKVNELNVSAREIIFEPMLIERLLAVHSPYRRSVSPGKFLFDSAGSLGPALGNVTSATLLGQGELSGDLALPFIGWVFRTLINDTNFGEGAIKVENTNTGLIAEYIIPNDIEESTICFLNHVPDFTANSQTDVVFDAVAGTVVGTAASTTKDVDTQYTFYPLWGDAAVGFEDEKNYAITATGKRSEWELTANNAIIYAYPVFMTRQLAALIDTLISADRLGELATFIASGYATDRQFNTK
jgi:hypothetical protein